jgi:hypothetical protein
VQTLFEPQAPERDDPIAEKAQLSPVELMMVLAINFIVIMLSYLPSWSGFIQELITTFLKRNE